MNNEKEKFIPLEKIPEKPTRKEIDKMDDLGRRLEMLEKRIKETTTFLIFLASAVIIAFVLAIIPLCFDYYKNNYERYEKYFKGIDELKIRMEILEKRNDMMWENQIRK